MTTKSNIFLAVLPSNDNRLALTQKISACEAKRSPLVRVQWAHTQDLHITIGYIENVEEADIRGIALGFTAVSQNPPLMATGEEVRLYGNAIVLRVEPQQKLLAIHKKMNQKLQELSDNKYQFLTHKRFDPHLTIGRIRNLAALNPMHKHHLMSLVEEQFKNTAFLIQQAALLRHAPSHSAPVYQTLQQYLFTK